MQSGKYSINVSELESGISRYMGLKISVRIASYVHTDQKSTEEKVLGAV
jgi:hypothetical protein